MSTPFKLPDSLSKAASSTQRVLIQATNFDAEPEELVEFYCDAEWVLYLFIYFKIFASRSRRYAECWRVHFCFGSMLRNASPYFVTALSGHWSEAQQVQTAVKKSADTERAHKRQKTSHGETDTSSNETPPQAIIDFRVEDAQIVLCMLQHLHPDCFMTFDGQNWKGLLSLAHKYEINELLQDCVEYIREEVLPKDPAAVMQHSHDIQLLSLFNESSAYILQESSAARRHLLNDLDPALRCLVSDLCSVWTRRVCSILNSQAFYHESWSANGAIIFKKP